MTSLIVHSLLFKASDPPGILHTSLAVTFLLSISGSQGVVSGPAASASVNQLLEMKIMGLTQTYEVKPPRPRSAICGLPSPPNDSDER